MSSRRSRFKVAASIPVRRKPGGNTEAINDPQTKAEVLNSEVVLDKKNETECETPVENSNVKPKPCEELSTIIPDDKPVFKRLKPPVIVPIKKERSRSHPAEVADVTTVNSSPVLSKDVETIQNSQDSHILADNRPLKLTHNTNGEVFNDECKIKDQANILTESKPSEELLSVSPHPKPCAVSSTAPALGPFRARFVRPALVDSVIRRHSVHASSASESEDENRKNSLSRTRKTSESAAVVRTDVQTSQASGADPDTNECARLALMPKRKRQKISNFVRKIAEARRDFNKKFAGEKPDRSNLTMFDLIFYNPHSSIKSQSKTKSKPGDNNPIIEEDEWRELLEEEGEDDPDKVDDGGTEEPAMPAPRVKIGANGEIILDEKSLMIETTEAKKGREALLNKVPIFEDKNRRVSYYGKKQTRFKDWSPIETKCFYKALNSIGTDFALMQALFPDRTRAELKNKFKREERINSALIDAAISRPSEFNIALLKEEIDGERAMVEKEMKRKMDETNRLEQERKEEQAARKAERTETGPWAALKQFVGAPEVGEKRARRSQRGASRRILCEDYIDPFEVDDEVRESGIKNQGKENISRLRPPSKKQVESVSSTPDDENTHRGGDLSSSENNAKRRKTERIMKTLKPNKKKRKQGQSITEYYSVEQGNSDCESVVSVIGSEKTEEIDNDEFVELMQRNMQNLETATIRVQAPSPSSGEPGIRVVLDVPPNLSNNKNNRRLGADKPVSRTFKVQNHFKRPAIDLGLANSEAHKKFEGSCDEIQGQEPLCLTAPKDGDSSTRGHLNSQSTNVDVFRSSKCENDTTTNIQNAFQEIETETVFTFPSPSPKQPIQETMPHKYSKVTNDNLKMEGADKIEPINDATVFVVPQPSPSHQPVTPEKVAIVVPHSSPSYQPVTSEGNYEMIERDETLDDCYNQETDCASQSQSQESCKQSNQSTEGEAQVNYRVTGDLEYALIEAGTEPEQRRTYLAGLRPGTFVFVATEVSQAPLERRCSMFMIAEKISPTGEKTFTPMPVILPPELMQLISQELNCA